MPTQGEGRPRVVTIVVIAGVVVGLAALTVFFAAAGLNAAQQWAGVLALYATVLTGLSPVLRRWLSRRPPPSTMRSEGMPERLSERPASAEHGPRRLLLPLFALAACGLLAVLAWLSVSTSFRVAAVTALGVLLPVSLLTWTEAYGPGSVRLSQLFSYLFGYRSSGYERRYVEHVQAIADAGTDTALTITTGHPVRLRDVFVDAKLAPSRPQRARTTVLPSPTERAIGGPTTFNGLLSESKGRVLAVLGAPGAGKTSLLQVQVHTIATEGRGRRRPLPVLLYLRQHVDRIVRDAPALSALIADATGLPDPEPPAWWERNLRVGRCVVLFDGLDEVGSDDARRAVVGWVQAQVERYRRNHFVLTSRPAGYRTNRLGNVHTFEIQPFDDTQIEEYLTRWFRVVLAADDKPHRDADVRQAVVALAGQSRTNPDLWELAASPLLLSMIANVHYDSGRLPRNRAGLYREICEVVLIRRWQEKKLPVGRSGERKVNVLARLGYTMVASGRPELPYAAVLDAVRPALVEYDVPLSPEEFLCEPGVEKELLQEIQVGTFAFAHRTIGEYLAARHLHEHAAADELVGHVEDPWWRETILLYLTDRSADSGPARRRIVEACVDRCTRDTLSLALELQADDLADDPVLLTQLRALREEAYDESTEHERRMVIVGALVQNALRPLASGASTTALCARPIGPELYVLYHRLTGAPAPPAPTRPVPLGSAIAGLWPADVRRLVGWVNDVAGEPDGTRYRLPEPAELDAVAARRVLPGNTPDDEYAGVWCRDTVGGRMALWTPNGRAHPHRIDATDLESAVAADVGGDSGLGAIVAATRTVGSLRPDSLDDSIRGVSSELRGAFDAARKLAEVVRHTPPVDAEPEAMEADQRTLVSGITDGLHAARTEAQSLERAFEVYGRAMERFGRRSWPGPESLTIRANASEATRACQEGASAAATLAAAIHERQTAIARAVAADGPPWRGKTPKPLERRRLSDLTEGHLSRLRRAQQRVSRCTSAVDGALPKALAAGFAALVRPGGPAADVPAALRDVLPLAALSRWHGGTDRTPPEHALATWLVRAGGPDSGVVDLDEVVAAAQRIESAADRDTGATRGGPPWLAAVAGRFARDCLAVASRERALTPTDATRLRLAALVLAASSGRNAQDAGDYRALAAGITLLELRGRTRVPAEIVHLCRE